MVRLSTSSLSSESDTLLLNLIEAVEALTLEIQELRQETQEQAQEEDANRPLRVGDRVRIVSRQLFGTEGTVDSFTPQRVRIRVEGRRQLVLRTQNNLERIIQILETQ